MNNIRYARLRLALAESGQLTKVARPPKHYRHKKVIRVGRRSQSTILANTTSELRVLTQLAQTYGR